MYGVEEGLGAVIVRWDRDSPADQTAVHAAEPKCRFIDGSLRVDATKPVFIRVMQSSAIDHPLFVTGIHHVRRPG